MQKLDYRPLSIDFEVATNQVTENLGTFETEKELYAFVHDNLIAVNEKVTAIRFIDAFEKSELRKEYSDLLENKLPFVKKDLQKAEIAFNNAKELVKELKQQVEATQCEAESLAVSVKIGTKEINLDDAYTFRVAVDNKYYFYTWVDKQLKLCKIRDIPAHEKDQLFNAQSKNATFFENEQAGA